MNKFVCEGSSIFNIDFAAAMFHGVENSNAQISLFINDSCDISDNKEHRKYISRLSLPTIKWEMDKNSVWRLIHIPIEHIHIDNYNNIIKSLHNDILFYLYRGGINKDNIDNKVLEKFLQYHDIGAFSSLKLYLQIIKNIFEQTITNDISISDSSALLSISNTVFSFEALLESLEPHKILKFTKGSAIEININNTWTTYNKILYAFNEIIFINNNDSYRTIKSEFINNLIANKIQIKFRGGLKIFLVKQFGDPVHIPWYYNVRNYFGESDFSIQEIISPISVSDRLRVSHLSNGYSYRLSPSGYSLIEYESSKVIYLLRGIFNNKNIEYYHLNDWINLINTYPISKERVSSHQGEIHVYLDKQIKHNKLLLRQNIIDSLSTLEEKKLTFPIYGQYLIQLYVFISHIKDCNNSKSNINYTDDFLSFLNKLNYRDIEENIELFCEDIILKTNIIIDELKTMGLDKATSLTINRSLHKYQTNKTSIKYMLSLLMEYIRVIALEYYKFSSFFVSTVLKGNIFTSYLLFGNEYSKEIENVLHKRKTAKKLCMSIRFVEQ